MTLASVFGLVTQTIFSLTIIEKSGRFSSLLCPSTPGPKCLLAQGVTDHDSHWELDTNHGGYVYELKEKPNLAEILGTPVAARFIDNDIPQSSDVWHILLGLYDTISPQVANLNFSGVPKQKFQSPIGIGSPEVVSTIDLPDVKKAQITKVLLYKATKNGKFVDLVDEKLAPKERGVKTETADACQKRAGPVTKCSSYDSCLDQIVKHLKCYVKDQ